MRSARRPTGTLDWALWDIATPRPPCRLPGVGMAGFRPRVHTSADIAMIAHPSLTLLVDMSDEGSLLHDAHGRRGRGSVVAGLLPGALRASGRVGEVLQIRLDPVAAAVLLRASPDLCGTVVPLEEVWGRDAGQAEERLRAAASWDERFAAVVDILGRRLTEPPAARSPVDGEVAHAWRRIRASRGRIRVDSLADEVGWSRKRLSARFRSQLGIAPNAPPAWCASTMPPTFSRRVSARSTSPPRAATSTSPISRTRSRSSPVSRPRRWPPRRGSRSTTSRGPRRRRPGARGRADEPTGPGGGNVQRAAVSVR